MILKIYLCNPDLFSENLKYLIDTFIWRSNNLFRLYTFKSELLVSLSNVFLSSSISDQSSS